MKKIVFVIFAVFCVIFTILSGIMFLAKTTISRGFRVGEIVKFSSKRNGIVGFNTWEGQVNITPSESWAFSIKENENFSSLTNKMDRAVNDRLIAKVIYTEHKWLPPWEAKTKYLVSDIILLTNVSHTNNINKTTQPNPTH